MNHDEYQKAIRFIVMDYENAKVKIFTEREAEINKIKANALTTNNYAEKFVQLINSEYFTADVFYDLIFCLKIIKIQQNQLTLIKFNNFLKKIIF